MALVLWGTDNLKTEGVSIAQALALLGAEPRQDSYGRVVGARGGPETKRGARGRRVGDTPEVRERSIVSRPRGLVGARRVLTLPETSNADSDNADSE